MRVSLSLILCLCAATPAFAAPAGTAKGKFTVNGVTAEIRHAVAVPWTNKDDGRQGLKVLLSDVPIPDDAVARDGEGFDPQDKPGQVHAIEYIIYPEGADSGTLYHPGIKDYSSTIAGRAQFTSAVMDANTVAGRLYMEEPDDFFDRVYFYDVTFRAPISRAPDAAGGPPAGTAQGTWTVNDQTAPLRYAYAVARRDFVGDPEKIYVVLSEKEIPADILLENFGLHKLESAGNFRALEFQLDPKTGIESNQLYHDVLERGSFSSSGSNHKWVPRVFDKKTVAGRLFMTKPDDFFERVYHYSVAFRADVQRKPPPTFVGAAAALSGPGKVATAFMRAARLGNKLAVKKLVDPAMAAQLDGPDGVMLLKMMKASFTLGLKVVEVNEKGDTADITAMKGVKGGRETVKLHTLKINGEWKVGREGSPDAPAKPRDPPTPEQIAAAETGPGKLLLAFADAIHEKNVARMKALSANPDEFKDLEGPFGEMALDIMSKVFPWDLRINRVTQTGDTAVVEAETASATEPLKVDTVLIKGVWKIAGKHKPAEAP